MAKTALDEKKIEHYGIRFVCIKQLCEHDFSVHMPLPYLLKELTLKTAMLVHRTIANYGSCFAKQ